MPFSLFDVMLETVSEVRNRSNGCIVAERDSSPLFRNPPASSHRLLAPIQNVSSMTGHPNPTKYCFGSERLPAETLSSKSVISPPLNGPALANAAYGFPSKENLSPYGRASRSS
jgi:hypothetical protein